MSIGQNIASLEATLKVIGRDVDTLQATPKRKVKETLSRLQRLKYKMEDLWSSEEFPKELQYKSRHMDDHFKYQLKRLAHMLAFRSLAAQEITKEKKEEFLTLYFDFAQDTYFCQNLETEEGILLKKKYQKTIELLQQQIVETGVACHRSVKILFSLLDLH